MADRQIYQLTAKTPTLSDILPVQPFDNSSEAKGVSLGDVKNLFVVLDFFALDITQSGTSNPTVSIINATRDGFTCTGVRLSTGIFEFTTNNGALLSNSMFTWFPTDGSYGITVNFSKISTLVFQLSLRSGGLLTDSLNVIVKIEKLS